MAIEKSYGNSYGDSANAAFAREGGLCYGEAGSEHRMHFSLYTTQRPDRGVLDTVESAILSALRGSCQSGTVRFSDVTTPHDFGNRIDFDVESEGVVNVDVVLDAAETVHGVKRAVFRNEGEAIRATITGPNAEP